MVSVPKDRGLPVAGLGLGAADVLILCNPLNFANPLTYNPR